MPVKIIANAALCGLALFIGYKLVIIDKVGELERNVSKESTFRQTFETKQARANQLPAFRAQLKEMQHSLNNPRRTFRCLRYLSIQLSSSQIREAVGKGDVGHARVMLGRWFSVAGTVVHGQGRGRSLGFRTANLACTPGVLAPATGVYAVFLEVVDGPLAGRQFWRHCRANPV